MTRARTMDVTMESPQRCACGAPWQSHRAPATRYRIALVRAMAHAERSAPIRRSASISDRHLPRDMF
jgi:hypothetical protein